MRILECKKTLEDREGKIGDNMSVGVLSYEVYEILKFSREARLWVSLNEKLLFQSLGLKN